METGLLIRIRGQVQGVGFRPFVWRLSQQFGVRGDVANDAEGVLIRAAGANVDAFVHSIRSDPPPLAQIDAVEVVPTTFPTAPDGFRIAPSGSAGSRTRVAPDAATCGDCIDEIRGDGRRQAYAFTNCTNCGPRFSIVQSVPYDRARTTMAPFKMCAQCRSEYYDPNDRRFHAQPIACPNCGPELEIVPPGGPPLTEAARRLLAGDILAIKGLGGFHIACDARNPEAIATLRQRKRRPTKPLALMGTGAMTETYAEPTPEEFARLNHPAAPIVLLARGGSPLQDAIAPGSPTLGWMLPYTPLHHLLIEAVGGPLVMTSGNLSGEPQVIANDEAQADLAGIVDGFVLHNRDIARRLDDSVERVTPHGPMILRHARGRAPATRPLPDGFSDALQVVAYGGNLKAAICLTKDGQALLSHHLGDLDDAKTWGAFVDADKDYRDLFDHEPTVAACDLHPDYRSSRYAVDRGLPLVEVQHHHAHLASCLADNGWPRDGGKVAGIVLDGLGLGSDGTVWGGEILVGDYAGFRRAAWLKPAPLPGGDAANREPWRNLLARLDQAADPAAAERMLAGKPVEILRRAVAAGVNAPQCSSAGRLFDAMAAGLGIAPDRQTFEGEAAMALEALALRGGRVSPRNLPVQDEMIDPAPLFQDLVDRTEPPEILAARFHTSLAHAFANEARRLIDAGEAVAVALSGGCLQNALLLDLFMRALSGLTVLHHKSVPANDGGLALGQALIAIGTLQSA